MAQNRKPEGGTAMFGENVVGRLSLYRRLLRVLEHRGIENVFSHELAAQARVTAAQVRRDVMQLGFSGSPARGYAVEGLIQCIARALDDPQGESVALVGIGNLGRAIMAYFAGRRPSLSIVAAFDRDEAKVNRVVHGVRCYPVEELTEVVRSQGIRVGIITVPAPAAQEMADMLVSAGVRGLLNLAPRPLHIRPGVYVESVDVTTALEKVAYFARQGVAEKKGKENRE